jgi:diguanylate cyclase (GGDEF)-like protein
MAAPFVASAPCSHTPGRRQLEDLEMSGWVRRATGLHNRRAFILLAEQTVKEAARVQRSVIGVFLDVDHLKVINDREGRR